MWGAKVRQVEFERAEVGHLLPARVQLEHAAVQSFFDVDAGQVGHAAAARRAGAADPLRKLGGVERAAP
jgi:hypothetical protein